MSKLNIPGLEETIDSVKTLKSEMLLLVDILANNTKEANKLSDSQKKQAKSIVEVTKEVKALQAAEKTSNELKKEILSTNEKVIQGQIKIAKATREAKKEQELIVRISEAEKGSKEQLSAQLALNTMRLNKMSEAQRENTTEGKNLIKETAELNQKLKDLDATVGVHNRNVGDYKDTTVSIKQEMRNLTVQIAQAKLEQKEHTPEIVKAKERLAELKDTMADVNNEAKNLGSDTKNVDRIAGSIETLGNAAQATQAGMMLLGGEEEDLAQVMAKTMLIQSGVNAVQGVANSLQKESVFMQGVNAVATKSNTAAQAIYAAAVGTSTGAMKLFRIALLATGIGAIVAGIILLAENWDRLTGSITDSTKELEDFQKKNDEILQAENAVLEVTKKRAKLASDVTKAEIESSEDRLDALDIEREKIDALLYSDEISTSKRKELSDRKREISKEEFDLNQKIRLGEIDLQKQLQEEKKQFEKLEEESFQKKKQRDRETEKIEKEQVEKLAKIRQEQAEMYSKYLEDIEAMEQISFEQSQENKSNNYELTKEQIAQQYEEELNAIDQQYMSKLDMQNLNEQQIADLDEKRKNDMIASELNYWTAILLIAKKGSEDYTSAMTAITQLRLTKTVADNQKRIESEKWMTDTRKKILETEIEAVSNAAQIFSGIAKKNSALAKAAFIIQKAAAIAKVWTEVYAANAMAIAQGTALAVPTFGGSVAAASGFATANTINAIVQTGLIAAQTVAEFAKGTKDAPGGLAIVGEKGPELVKEPGGKMWLTPPSDTLVNLPKHSEVIPAHLVAEELNSVMKLPEIVFKNDNQRIVELLEKQLKRPPVIISGDPESIRIKQIRANKLANHISRYRC